MPLNFRLLRLLAVSIALLLITGCAETTPAETPKPLPEKPSPVAAPEALPPAPKKLPRLALQSIEIGFDEAAIKQADSRAQLRCLGDTGKIRTCQALKPLVVGGKEHGSPIPHYQLTLDETDRVVRVEREFNNSSFEMLVMGAKEKFGEPDSDKSSAVQNRLGATFDQRIITWEGDNATLTLSKRGRDVDSALFELTKKHSFRESVDIISKQAKEIADQL